MRDRFIKALTLFGLAALSFSPSLASTTLDKVRSAGSLNCGVNIEEPEYTMKDAHGNHSLLDQDFCKAVAVVVLGPQAKFAIKIFRDEASSLQALKAGNIDVLASTSANIRTTRGDIALAHPIFYDYQGLLVNKTLGIRSKSDLAGKKVCFLIGTEIQTQLGSYMSREKIAYIPGPFSEEGEMEAAFLTGTCAAISADVTQLAYEKIAFRQMASHYEILTEVIALDPLAPASRNEDAQWASIVDWTVQALIQAEELGITQSNIQEKRECSDIRVQRLLGTNRGWGQFLGLDDQWASRAVAAGGNYGQMFDRDLGTGSPLKLPRGLNRLWNDGGLMLAYPLR